VITLNVKTPVGRQIHTNGHRGKSFFTVPCSINVFAGTVLLETLDANGQVDFRKEITAKDGKSPVDVDLDPVAAAPAPKAAPNTEAKPAPKTAPKAPAKPKSGRSAPGTPGGAR